MEAALTLMYVATVYLMAYLLHLLVRAAYRGEGMLYPRRTYDTGNLVLKPR